jgi:enoyl-CoA hydratase/carnithine racemase
MYEAIRYEVAAPVATITLDRPEAMNAWTGNMDREIRDAIRRAEADTSVVGIVITGAGRAFCAGADMNLLSDLSSGQGSGGDGAPLVDAPSDDVDNVPTDFAGRFSWLMTTTKPIIAAINGATAGMAYPFALCCDLRIGTPQSLFVTAFAQRGLIAEWGLSWLLPRLVGPAVAMDLLLSSRRVNGEEALRLGLLNEMVAPEELLPRCHAYIEHLATNCSPASMAIMKQQVNRSFHAGIAAAEAEAERLMAESFTRPDFAEGVQSFLQRRPPEFPRLPLGN